MDKVEFHRLLRRGLLSKIIISRILNVLLVSGSVVAFILWFEYDVPNSWVWELFMLIFANLLYTNSLFLTKKVFLAELVAENPGITYWVHPLAGPDGSFDHCKCIQLHLRNGKVLTVELPETKMQVLVAWLHEANAEIHWGQLGSLVSPT